MASNADNGSRLWRGMRHLLFGDEYAFVQAVGESLTAR